MELDNYEKDLINYFTFLPNETILYVALNIPMHIYQRSKQYHIRLRCIKFNISNRYLFTYLLGNNII